MKTWIALMGKRDAPTDGVEDYCVFLGNALSQHGVDLKQVRVSWSDAGWNRALRELRQSSGSWRGEWALVQYTGLGWSRRGFPFGAARVVNLLSRQGVRCALVFHEFARQSTGQRWIDRIRGACQDAVIRRLYRQASAAIFTVPLETVPWLPPQDRKAVFIPIGANIPERLGPRQSPVAGGSKTVAIFGVTEAPHTASESETIAAIARQAARIVPNLRLVVVGRGSLEAGKLLAPALSGDGVKVVAKGVLPAEVVASELEAADAFLFIRGPITPQRGSALAGIACGLPIVGYRNGRIVPPLDDAGIEWATLGDTDALARGLVRVLTDPQRWAELRERNLRLQAETLSWGRIACRYLGALSE